MKNKILISILSILIIAIGMYIYNSASSTITSSVSSMSTQEKDAFNNQFTAYENAQTGSKVKALIGVLIANSNTYEDEVAKIPTLTIKIASTMPVNSLMNAINERPAALPIMSIEPPTPVQ